MTRPESPWRSAISWPDEANGHAFPYANLSGAPARALMIIKRRC
jgi:hypothetical protein